MNDFDLIASWVEENGFRVIFEPGIDGIIDPQEKIVCINSERPEECNKYYLLHECGHIIIRNDHKFFKAKYTGRYSDNRDHYNLSLLSEEFDAWFEGKALAEELQVNIDEKKWNTIMNRSLMEYATLISEGGMF
tara:strand:+ start:724 stop:1125 length:402 start_codon:yes stop_codon:yes gene_type:complete